MMFFIIAAKRVISLCTMRHIQRGNIEVDVFKTTGSLESVWCLGHSYKHQKISSFMIKPILVILLLKCSLLREVILKRGRFKESFCVIKAAYGLEGELSLDLLLWHFNNSLTFGSIFVFAWERRIVILMSAMVFC